MKTASLPMHGMPEGKPPWTLWWTISHSLRHEGVRHGGLLHQKPGSSLSSDPDLLFSQLGLAGIRPFRPERLPDVQASAKSCEPRPSRLQPQGHACEQLLEQRAPEEMRPDAL
jgi:hypothetical protein